MMHVASPFAGGDKKNSPSKLTAQPAQAASVRVRWRENADREITTRVERDALNLLVKEQELSFETLVDFIAEALFHEEVHEGASAIDLGLLGSGLFVAEARRILQERHGQLWEIVSL